MSLRPKSAVIRAFIVDHVASHPNDLAQFVAESFGMTAQAARNHIRALEFGGVLEATGRTRAKSFSLRNLARHTKTHKRVGLQEDLVWNRDLRPHLEGCRENVLSICGIAFEEMLNNAIDHSGSRSIEVEMSRTAATIRFRIRDRGIGIFRKIKDSLKLPEERMAILELSKGKLTTAPDAHTGYGIFFTSRMVDLFSIRSGDLGFHHTLLDDRWSIENHETLEGTQIEFTVSTSVKRSAGSVYDEFCTHPDDTEDPSSAFNKTHVPLRLAQYNNEQLISRSQAKRVLARFERFAKVLLDFEGVPFIGQAFADEIFRVFALRHPDVAIIPIRASKPVMQMINLAKPPGARKR